MQDQLPGHPQEDRPDPVTSERTHPAVSLPAAEGGRGNHREQLLAVFAGQEGEAGISPAEDQRSCPPVSLESSPPEETIPSYPGRPRPLPGGCQRFPGQTRAERSDPGCDDNTDLVEVNPGDEGGEGAVPQHQGQSRHHPECVAREEGESEIREAPGQHCPLSGCGARLDCQEEAEQTDPGSHHHPAGSEESHPGNVDHNIYYSLFFI